MDNDSKDDHISSVVSMMLPMFYVTKLVMLKAVSSLAEMIASSGIF